MAVYHELSVQKSCPEPTSWTQTTQGGKQTKYHIRQHCNHIVVYSDDSYNTVLTYSRLRGLVPERRVVDDLQTLARETVYCW